MARYIDADALIERLGINQDCTECSYCTRKYFCSWNPDPGEICIAISEQPTVTINDLTEEIKATNCNYNQFADVSKKGDTISRKAVYDALECMRFASDAERRYAFSMVEQIPIAEPEHNVHDSVKDADCISRQQAIDTAVTFVRRTLLDSKPIDVKMSSDYIFVNLVEPMRKLPSVQPEPEPVGCYGCRYERFGNRVCDVCSRLYADRYSAERRTDERFD